MRTVGLADAKAQLSALIDAVEAGDEVVITRRGEPVARLVRNTTAGEPVATDWATQLRRLHAGQKPTTANAVDLVRDLRAAAEER
jgi:antitoxin (DNA-binding transcriptional repressor) of toxin-antitoxin stability system